MLGFRVYLCIDEGFATDRVFAMTHNDIWYGCESSRLEHLLLAELANISKKLAEDLPCRSDLEEIADFPLKKCTLCSYSNGGQLFAAAGIGNVITVWSAITHQVLAVFKVSCSLIIL